MSAWHEDAKRYRFVDGLSWSETSKRIREEYFEDEPQQIVHERVRGYLRKTPEYKAVSDDYLEYKEPTIIRNKWTGDKIIRFGLMGDTQINSKYTQITHLHKYYDICQREGIEDVYHTGDMDEGEQMRPGHQYENYTQGVDDHIDEIVKVYPKRKGITTHFITGNHDTSIFKRVGFDIGSVIAGRRDDMKYLGRDRAIIQITPNCEMELRHPWDGTAYALSYKMQKMIEAIGADEKPNILAVGHYHKIEYMFYRNVHAFQTGCFQGPTPFTVGKGISVHLGGWIIEINVDEKGTITKIKQEMIPFYKAIKEDYKNWR